QALDDLDILFGQRVRDADLKVIVRVEQQLLNIQSHEPPDGGDTSAHVHSLQRIAAGGLAMAPGMVFLARASIPVPSGRVDEVAAGRYSVRSRRLALDGLSD